MEINLLPNDLQEAQSQKRTMFYVNVGTFIILGLLALSVVGMFVYRTTVSNRLATVDTEVQDLRRQVESQSVVEGSLKAIQLKLNKLRGILATTYPYGEILNELETLSTTDITLSEIEIEEQDEFMITGVTTSLEQLDSYVQSLSLAKEQYKDLRVSDIRFNESDFTFNFTLLFRYEEI